MIARDERHNRDGRRRSQIGPVLSETGEERLDHIPQKHEKSSLTDGFAAKH
jgi:hypothetical protein